MISSVTFTSEMTNMIIIKISFDRMMIDLKIASLLLIQKYLEIKKIVHDKLQELKTVSALTSTGHPRCAIGYFIPSNYAGDFVL